MNKNTTIVISCAGMGTRLGLGCTKALVDVAGKPLVCRQLELLKDYDDIRVVVGYQAEKVIETIRKYRDDVVFAFNHNYKNTGTGASFLIGAENAREYVVALDGDLLVHPDDLKAVIDYPGNVIGGTTPSTDNPVLMRTGKTDKRLQVTSFSCESGDYEWTGFAKIEKARLGKGSGHVYQLLEPILPMDMVFVRTKEIDTVDDYDRAVAWVKNNYED